MVTRLVVGVLMLVVNAYFVGGEFALVSVRRSQIEPLAEAGDRRARRVLWGLEHVSALLATAQLGITLSTLVLGAVAEPAFAHLLEPVFEVMGLPGAVVHAPAFVIALAVATYLHMLFAEMVPKNMALAAPERSALLLGGSLVVFSRALRPVVFGINALANGVLRVLRVEPKDEVTAAFSGDELGRIVADSSAAGLLDARATERLRDALELARRPAGEVVRPGSAVVSAREGITPEELERLSARTGYSRFPVTGGSGRVLGYLHVKDALGAQRRDAPFAAGALRPVARVQEATALDEVLASIRTSATHLAVVTGPQGRAVGVVTLEDVLRELVGGGPGTGRG